MLSPTIARTLLSIVSLASTLPAFTLADVLVAPANVSTAEEITANFYTNYETSSQQIWAVKPLTESVGKSSQTQASAMHFAGNLVFGNESTQNSIGKGDIVYINCDPTAGFIDPSTITNKVAERFPAGIVFYSLTLPECTFSGSTTYQTIYTITNKTAAGQLEMLIKSSPGTLAARVWPANSTETNNHPGQNTNPGGPAPTTAVAMSILYSITGIITLLFLVIIATGAIRAHRHPERYGPRTGNTGRPRQSRAKGLGRAIVEALPLVKFGDPEPTKKSVNADIELGNGNGSVHSAEHPRAPETSGALKAIPAGAAVVESGMNNDTQTGESSGKVETPAEGDLGCSICTEDFAKGEDVRLLPCNHKYHPDCIDPWLLNVSGTCPLCRHDLRPKQEDGTVAEGDELPPPLSADEAGEAAATEAPSANRRRSRLLDLTRLRHAPPDERIAALRILRQQSQAEVTAAADPEERSRSARLTGRLRDTFRIRTRRQNEEQTPPTT